MTEVATNGRGTLPPSPRFLEIQEGLALRANIPQRVAELHAMERQAELQLYGIRAAIGEMEAQLTKASLPSPPPTPT